MIQQVLHPHGMAFVGCAQVNITSSGSVDSGDWPPCFYGPYQIGNWGDGSYTFTFSPPVSGVRVDVQALNAWGPPVALEEMYFIVNGIFYPITIPGVVDGCYSPAIIWPTGTIRAQPDEVGSWKDIAINETITTLTIGDTWLSGFAAGFSINLFICCSCDSDAGQLSGGSLSLCTTDIAIVPPAEQTYLDNGDLLQYILFSDPADTLGSIINKSSAPEFSFDPVTMSYGVTYYIAAVAGNNLGGNVDLNDLCLDISNAIEVVWHPLPTVMFSTPNADACPGDCHYIEVNFTGTPPFQLSGEVVSGANIVSAFNQTYLDYSGILTVCLPPDTALGSLNVNATELIDGFCTCD